MVGGLGFCGGVRVVWGVGGRAAVCVRSEDRAQAAGEAVEGAAGETAAGPAAEAEVAPAGETDVGSEAENGREKVRRRRRVRRRPKKKLSDMKIGDKRYGVVKNFVDWGAYVSVGAERDGLLHVRDMSQDFVRHPEDILRLGEKVKVFVKYVDSENKKLALSMVQRELVEERKRLEEIEEGTRLEGTVVRVSNYGAFVDVGAQVDGFLHVTELWGDRKRDTLDNLRYGEKLDVLVQECLPYNQRLRLSLAQIPEEYQTKNSIYGRSFGSVPQEVVLQRPADQNKSEIPVVEVDEFDVDSWDGSFEEEDSANKERSERKEETTLEEVDDVVMAMDDLEFDDEVGDEVGYEDEDLGFDVDEEDEEDEDEDDDDDHDDHDYDDLEPDVNAQISEEMDSADRISKRQSLE